MKQGRANNSLTSRIEPTPLKQSHSMIDLLHLGLCEGGRVSIHCIRLRLQVRCCHYQPEIFFHMKIVNLSVNL